MPSVFSTLGLPQKNLMLCGAMPPTECDHSLALPGLLGSVDDTNSLAASLAGVSFTICLSVSSRKMPCCDDAFPVTGSVLLALPEAAIVSSSSFSAQTLMCSDLLTVLN